jgi:Tfp pilus assembly protein PilF
MSVLDDAIRRDPGNAGAWDAKASIYRAMGKHAEADAALARAGDLRMGR